MARRRFTLSLHFVASLCRFTLSLQLPIEIRQIIWNLTLESRFVEVRPKAHNQAGFFTLTPTPTALSVCQDSRDAVLQFYPNLLDKEYVIHPNKLTVYDQAVGAAIPGTKLNSCMDVLYLDWRIADNLDIFLKQMSNPLAPNILYLALNQNLMFQRTTPHHFDKCKQIKVHNGQFQPVPDEHNCFSVDFEWRILEDDAVDFFTNIIVSMWEPQELVFVSDAYGLDPYCFYQARNERAALTIFMDDYIYVFRAPNNDPIYDYRDELYAMRSLAYRDPFRYDCLLRIHKYGLNIRHCLKFGWRFPASESPNVATMDTYTSW
ncbi:hypothetical protein DID88_004916 [Monilinia fructigena]|uniref:2EXR domain-containing protein n=1 Tax=Monilinia fructigena TaxID=38457 RepID=A0A395IPY2_9HELO|nr:hypothetical protein DID88_004916 [Monilinia fructigena]